MNNTDIALLIVVGYFAIWMMAWMYEWYTRFDNSDEGLFTKMTKLSNALGGKRNFNQEINHTRPTNKKQLITTLGGKAQYKSHIKKRRKSLRRKMYIGVIIVVIICFLLSHYYNS